MEFYVSLFHEETSRKCYDLFDLFSDIGGVMAVITAVGKIVSEYFAESKMYAIAASNAYQHQIDPVESQLRTGCFGKHDKEIRKYSQKELISQPNGVSFYKLVLLCECCCSSY